jgi:cytochrome c biogenesis protein CcdA
MSTNPFSDPYRPPQHFSPPAEVLPGQRPPVMTWYAIYCAGMALLYLLCIALGVAFLAMPSEMLEDADSPEAVRIQGVVLIVMGVGLFLLYAIAPFLSRSKFAWIYGFVTIGIGLTSCCTLPFCIPLLIQWLKPEVKSYLNAG